MNELTRTSGLRDYLRVVRQQRLLIVAIALLFAGAALLYSVRTAPSYQAEASLRFQEPSATIDALGGLGDRQTPEERAALGADVVTRPDIVAAVEHDLKGPIDASVSASAESRTNLVVIRASASRAERAARVANSFATQTRRVLTASYRRGVARQVRAAKPEFDRIAKLGDPAAAADQLNREARLRALRRLAEPVSVARVATVPGGPTSPRPLRNTLLAALAGLTLGLVAAFARDSLDRRVRGARDLLGAAPFPVIGRLRKHALGRFRVPDGSDGRLARKAESALEDIRIVRANLALIGDRKPSRVLVTSPLPEEGKSTVAFSLAVANALAGRRTILVECDLRRPVLAPRLGIEVPRGLSDYLTGHASTDEIIYPIPVPGGAMSNGDGGEPETLACIPAGSTPARPVELLGSERLAALLTALSAAYDSVIMDSSPLLPVADSLELVPLVDRLVLCTRSRQTTRDQLKAAADAIGRVGDVAVGVVVTGARDGDELDYGYYQAAEESRRAQLTSSS